MPRPSRSRETTAGCEHSRDAQTKVGQEYVSGIVTEADPAVMLDAVFTAVDDDAVQVLMAPAQRKLKDGRGDRRSCCRYERAAGARSAG